MKYHNPITNKSHRKSTDKTQKVNSASVDNPWSDHDISQKCSIERLNSSALHAMSRKGLWGLLFFLIVSIAAFMVQDFNLYETFPEPVLQILGSPPPAVLIHLALTCYAFTIIVPVLIRMANGENPVVGWHHLFCRSIFYLFYLVSTTLPENFVAVSCIGILLYTVEQAGIWSYLYKNLSEAEVSG